MAHRHAAARRRMSSHLLRCALGALHGSRRRSCPPLHTGKHAVRSGRIPMRPAVKHIPCSMHPCPGHRIVCCSVLLRAAPHQAYGNRAGQVLRMAVKQLIQTLTGRTAPPGRGKTERTSPHALRQCSSQHTAGCHSVINPDEADPGCLGHAHPSGCPHHPCHTAPMVGGYRQQGQRSRHAGQSR